MTKGAKKYSALLSYVLIVLGTGIMGVSIQNYYDAIGLVTGGFTGLAIIIKAVTGEVIKGGIPLWLTNIVLNIPVFVFAFVLKGKKFVGRTFFGAFMLSFWLYVIPPVDLAQGDYLIAALFGGIFSGIGIGLVLRGHATTGGTDMVASLIQIKIKHYSVVKIMQFLDGAIVVVGMAVFGVRPTMYAVLAIYVTTKISDSILEGFNYSKAAYIITDKHEAIADKIMTDIDRGVTGLSAKGMYTKEDKCVLYCVVSKREIVQVKEIVGEIDSNAFVIVSDVHEVLGEGFKEYTKEL